MAEDTDISKEAFERVRRERDDLKAKLADAEQALGDVAQRDRFYEHFRQDPQLHDPYGLAALAVRDVTLRQTPQEQVGERLTSWLDEQRRLVAAPKQEEEPPPPQSPFQGPNPGTPGYEARVEPMVVGSERWAEWAKGKTAQEQMDAMRRGDAVSSDKVKQAQRTVTHGV